MNKPPGITHCGELQPLKLIYSFSLPESEDEHLSKFDYLELSWCNCKTCSQLLIGWRGVDHKGKKTPVRRITGSKETAKWLNWGLMHSKVKVAKGVDWVWSSKKVKPFNKQKVPVA